jgi:CspA family cold shock protein
MKIIEDKVLEGVVASFNKNRGFGFIATDQCDYFIHHSNINMSGYRFLDRGQKVTFSLGPGRNERVQALDVTVIE